MTKAYPYHNLTKVAATILLTLLSVVNYAPLVYAQTAQNVKNRVASKQTRLEKLNFPRSGAPTGRRKGGARRDSCPNLNQPVTALVPGEEGESGSVSFLALTVSKYPTFWVYVPELPSDLGFAEFVFQDERNKNIYRTFLKLPEKSGIIGINLPQNPQYALNTDKNYQWYFKVYCGNPQKTYEYFYTKAWVKRVATPKLESQLMAAKSKQYIAYAVNYLWYDALTDLAELRRANLDSSLLVEDWTDLLKAVGLEEFAEAPIVEVFHLEN